MKKADDIAIEILIADYTELKSSYKVAKKHDVSATAVKRILKGAGVLRTQDIAAKERTSVNNFKYVRTEEHKKTMSNLAKAKTGTKNPFYGKKHSVEVKQKLSDSAKTRTGKRNPNYKDGEYQRRPRDHKIAEFTRLRNFVFNRDDYTCKYCEGIGGHLHAHHKIPYWVKPEAFLDVDNLATVCTKCHFDKAHKGNWSKFDASLIDQRLIKRYSLDCERLNDLAENKNISDAIVRPADIHETAEENRNISLLLKKEE